MMTLTIILYLLVQVKMSNLIAWEFNMFNFQKYKPQWKVLNCTSCLGFWLSLCMNIFFMDYIFIIPFALVSSLVSQLIEKQIRILW